VSAAPPPARLAGPVLAATSAACFLIALAGPPDLVSSNEARVAAYVWDILQNGALVVPRDLSGELASKPPLYAWLASLAALAFGHWSPVPLYLPSAAATALLAGIICRAGGARFGWAAGFLGGLAYLLSPAVGKQMTMARYDALFALTVALTGAAAFRAWTLGRGWTWFWLAGAAATMTKGPLGLLLGASGLLAAAWERRTGHPAAIRGSHAAGAALFVGITAGWLLLAWLDAGASIVERLLVREIAGHAVSGKAGEAIGSGFYKPLGEMLAGTAPWSLLACLGAWRICRRPDPDPVIRRLERFLLCFLGSGLVVFSLAAHQRSRLVLPLLPALMAIAGREMARLVSAWPPRRVVAAAVVVAVVGLAVIAAHARLVKPGSRGAVETAQLRAAAAALGDTVGGAWMLTHVDTPVALQLHLRTMRPLVPAARAADLLRGDAPVMVAVMDWPALERALGGDAGLARLLARWPAGRDGHVHLVGNRPAGERPGSIRTALESLELTVTGVRVDSASRSEIRLRPLDADGAVTVVSLADRPRRLRLRWASAPSRERQAQRVLAPGEEWRWTSRDAFRDSPGPRS
jgi:4-amino-4-deoxy-L-arabinose transferase-like glycosyltransferase